MLGSASLLLPAVGLVLGVLATLNTHGRALPPAVGLLTALAVLGVFDALAGFVAASVFVVGVAAAGGFSTAPGIRTMLGAGRHLVRRAAHRRCGATPAAAAGPDHRRPPATPRRLRHCLAHRLLGDPEDDQCAARPGQKALPVAVDATTVAFVVLGASVLRMVLEGAAGRWYLRV